MLQRDGIAANSFMGRHLLQKSHPNSGNNYNAYSAYSINDVYEETPFVACRSPSSAASTTAN
jgi:hypothetical protein